MPLSSLASKANASIRVSSKKPCAASAAPSICPTLQPPTASATATPPTSSTPAATSAPPPSDRNRQTTPPPPANARRRRRAAVERPCPPARHALRMRASRGRDVSVIQGCMGRALLRLRNIRHPSPGPDRLSGLTFPAADHSNDLPRFYKNVGRWFKDVHECGHSARLGCAKARFTCRLLESSGTSPETPNGRSAPKLRTGRRC